MAPAVKVAVVLAAFASPNVTLPLPLTLLHVKVNAPGGFGSPSSVAEPLKVAMFGRVITWSGPAFTTGFLFTMTASVSLPESAPSLALSVSV